MPGVIRSNRLRWVLLSAWNTPLQFSDVIHEMRQTLQMSEQLRLISHRKCCLLRVSGLSSALRDCAWLDYQREEILPKWNLLKNKELFPILKGECFIFYSANSQSFLSKLWHFFCGVTSSPTATTMLITVLILDCIPCSILTQLWRCSSHVQKGIPFSTFCDCRE